MTQWGFPGAGSGGETVEPSAEVEWTGETVDLGLPTGTRCVTAVWEWLDEETPVAGDAGNLRAWFWRYSSA